MAVAACLGYPIVGMDQSYRMCLKAWRDGRIELNQLTLMFQATQGEAWQQMMSAGIDVLPSHDAAVFCRVYEWAAAMGLLTPVAGASPLMVAEQLLRRADDAHDVRTWFGSRQKFIVPVVSSTTVPRLLHNTALEAFKQAQQQKIITRPQLIGPLTLLSVCGGIDHDQRRKILPPLIEAYIAVLQSLAAAGCPMVLIDEPCLTGDGAALWLDDAAHTYRALRHCCGDMKLMLAFTHGAITDDAVWLMQLPVDAWHLDVVADPTQIRRLVGDMPSGALLSLGVVAAHSVWRTDFDTAFEYLRRGADAVGIDRIHVAANASLAQLPLSLAHESSMPGVLQSCLSFAHEKLTELAQLTNALNHGEDMVRDAFKQSRDALQRRRQMDGTFIKSVRQAVMNIKAKDYRRNSPNVVRRGMQADVLPHVSLPIVVPVEAAQSAAHVLVVADTSCHDDTGFLRDTHCLSGVYETKTGWVRSVADVWQRPVIVYGDIMWHQPPSVLPAAHTVQAPHQRVLAMHRGPMALLHSAFVRDDLNEQDVAQQLALVVRQRLAIVCQQHAASMIGLDEPTLLPKLNREDYRRAIDIAWAIDCVRLATACVPDDVPLVVCVHECDQRSSIADLVRCDADVLQFSHVAVTQQFAEALGEAFFPHAVIVPLQTDHAAAVSLQLQHYLQHLDASQLWLQPPLNVTTWPAVCAAIEQNRQAASRR